MPLPTVTYRTVTYRYRLFEDNQGSTLAAWDVVDVGIDVVFVLGVRVTGYNGV